MMRRDKPWKVDQWTMRERKEFLCYSGWMDGPVIWQQGSEIAHGEFHRRVDWNGNGNVPIHESAVIYLHSRHQCDSPEAARERAAVMAGFRKAFGVAPDGWRIAHKDDCDLLENYNGYDSFFLSLRETIRFYGQLSDRQLAAYRRMSWKLKRGY